MKKISILLIPFLSISLLLTNSCESWRNCYEGNGVITNEVRGLTGFSGVICSGDIDVHITQDTIYSVVVRTDENLQPVIKTNVRGENLYIEVSRNKCLRSGTIPTVFVSLPVLFEAEMDGSGKIYSSNTISSSYLELNITGSGDMDMDLQIEDLWANIDGSGDIQLYGNVDDANFSINGSGDIMACDCTINECIITIEGSGDVYVYVLSFLDIAIFGSGDVYYDGIPYPNRPPRIEGSGNVYSGDCRF